MKPEQIAIQLASLNSRLDIQNKSGTYFIEQYNNKLVTYINNSYSWSRQECEDYWHKEVGGAEKRLPAWMIHKINAASWVGENDSQKSKRVIENLAKWAATLSSGQTLLGDSLAWSRGRESQIRETLPMRCVYGFFCENSYCNNHNEFQAIETDQRKVQRILSDLKTTENVNHVVSSYFINRTGL